MNDHPYALITFDVYSALFDITSTLLPSVQDILALTQDAAQDFINEWRRLQLEYTLIHSLLQKPHLSFQVVTQRALDVVLYRRAITLSAEQRNYLLARWDVLEPWPEAPAVLRALHQANYPIALLSNGDVRQLERLAERLDVPFAHIFSAEQAGVYKPHPAIYMLPVSRLGVSPAAILHVAGSPRDVMGAKAAGLTCAWRNARRDRVLDPTYAADVEADNLITLFQRMSPPLLPSL